MRAGRTGVRGAGWTGNGGVRGPGGFERGNAALQIRYGLGELLDSIGKIVQVFTPL